MRKIIIGVFSVVLSIAFVAAIVDAQPSVGITKTPPLSGSGNVASPLKITVCADNQTYVSNGIAWVCEANASGGGTLNTVPLWTPDGNTLGNSIITQSGTTATVNGYLAIDTDGQSVPFSTRNGAIGAGNLWIGGGGESFVGGNPLGPEGRNTAVGVGAATAITTGFGNVAIGYGALIGGTTASTATAIGQSALGNVTTGIDNTAIGYMAGRDLSTGTENTTVGVESTELCTTGTKNTAMGLGAGFFTTGNRNTALGYQAGGGTTGIRNIAIGSESGQGITGADQAIAIGAFTMASVTAAEGNVAIGGSALNAVTSGQHNTAVGLFAAAGFTTGQENVAIGNHAMGGVGGNGTGNVAVGSFSQANKTSGDGNTTVGYHAGDTITTGEFNTVLGVNSTTGITTGRANTIIGGSIGGLAVGLSNNIILADGDGNIRAQWGSTGTLNHPGLIISGGINSSSGPTTIGKWTGTTATNSNTGVVNDFAGTGAATASTIRLTPAALLELTGLDASVYGGRVRIYNVGPGGAYFYHQNGLSLATNRFNNVTGLRWELFTGDAIEYEYDPVNLYWRQVAEAVSVNPYLGVTGTFEAAQGTPVNGITGFTTGLAYTGPIARDSSAGPGLSAGCGTGATVTTGNSRFTITTATVGLGTCIATFGIALNSATPTCTVTSRNAVPVVYTANATTITLTTGLVATQLYDVNCTDH